MTNPPGHVHRPPSIPRRTPLEGSALRACPERSLCLEVAGVVRGLLEHGDLDGCDLAGVGVAAGAEADRRAFLVRPTGKVLGARSDVTGLAVSCNLSLVVAGI